MKSTIFDIELSIHNDVDVAFNSPTASAFFFRAEW